MISLKSPQEIETMRQGGEKLAQILEELVRCATAGTTTQFLDALAEKLILDAGAYPVFKGYEGFPATICACINEEVVHAIPSQRKLEQGDLLTLDIGLRWKGLCVDMARTVAIGSLHDDARRLLEATKKAMTHGVREARAGNRVGDIGHAVQEYVESQGYNVVRDLCGHGIGKHLHEDPQVPNFGKRNTGELLQEGMVICIEPMVSAGDWKIKESSDGYGFLTKDGSLACHVEDTIAITSQGPEILTR